MSTCEKRKLFNKYYQRYKRLKSTKDEALQEGENEPSTSRAILGETSNEELTEYQCQAETSTYENSDENTFEENSDENTFEANQTPVGFVSEVDQAGIDPPAICQAGIDKKPLIVHLSHWAVTHNINHKAFSGLLQILRENNVDLPKDARTILKTPRNTGSLMEVVEPGFYFHFGLEQSIKNLMNRTRTNFKGKRVDTVLKICINIDGLPLSKSSGSQLWPIMVNLFQNKNVVEICGLYQGNEKPKNSNQFMNKFVEEAVGLINGGFVYKGINFKVKIIAFICDVPAKAFIKCTRGHSGYMSCSKCDTEGEFKSNRICFPAFEGLRLRTDLTFRSKEQESHHTGTSILEQIPGLDMITCFPLDYMHLICLGVVKKLINNLWLSGKPPNRFSSNQIKDLSQKHVALQNQIPHEFSRKPRSLSEIKRWKATELRLFLFYTGPVVLKDNVSENIYQNFMSLHVAVSLLSKNQNIDYANQLLKYFIETFSVLYGEENISHNIHNLLHIADDVKIFGSIENFSAFPFENNMLFLKALLRKGDQPLQQIVNRVAERKNLYQDERYKVDFPLLKSEHCNGPLLNNNVGIKQFKKVHLENFILSLDEANNCCLMNDKSIVDIKNIVSLNGIITIIGQNYLLPESFYSFPCESTNLNTFLLGGKGSIKSWSLSQVVNKFVKLKLNNKLVVFSLLHTNNN